MCKLVFEFIIQIFYVLAWAFVASYYFAWGANEPNIVDRFVDESGWSPDGILANAIIQETTE